MASWAMLEEMVAAMGSMAGLGNQEDWNRQWKRG